MCTPPPPAPNFSTDLDFWENGFCERVGCATVSEFLGNLARSLICMAWIRRQESTICTLAGKNLTWMTLIVFHVENGSSFYRPSFSVWGDYWIGWKNKSRCGQSKPWRTKKNSLCFRERRTFIGKLVPYRSAWQGLKFAVSQCPRVAKNLVLDTKLW